jgi:hypothetical protein
LLHDDEPGREYEPAGHGDSVALVAPAAHTNPALQLEHAPAPPMLNMPGAHTTAVAFVDAAGQ